MAASDHSSRSFTPKLPYLLSALVQWIQDNGCTPMLVASVATPGVCVPQGYERDGMITLNISDQAVQGLAIDQQLVSFSARFGGRQFDVRLPLASLQVLFAREDPQNSAVSLVEAAAELSENDKPEEQTRSSPKLRLVE